jgi:murein DD-endopeptidase MepM/ murein hydrolase activator NlpD
MIRFFLFLLFTTTLFASEVQRLKWKNDLTYLVFLERNGLPTKELYYNLDEDNQRLTEELRAGVNYQVLFGEKNAIEQILLPLNDELQIHIYKTKESYEFEAIPIISETRTEAFYATVVSSPLYTIKKYTGSNKLTNIFATGFKDSLNFKNESREGDKIVMIYDQMYRLNRPVSMPTLKAGMIEIQNKFHYIYLSDDENYYNEKGQEVEGFLLAVPVRGARISSHFTKRRFHPILKRWKAHLGVDYAARSGTPVVAAGAGRVIYASRLGAYGNLIKIRHEDGFETRYAHLKSIRKGVRNGGSVKKGQVIGYVGTTGRSTGPHLHFELRKQGNPLNPLKVVQVATKKLQGKEYKAFAALKKKYEDRIAEHIKNETQFIKLPKLESKCFIHYEELVKGETTKSDA